MSDKTDLMKVQESMGTRARTDEALREAYCSICYAMGRALAEGMMATSEALHELDVARLKVEKASEYLAGYRIGCDD